MDRALALLLAALALLLPATPALAQIHAEAGARVVATTSWVEEWDPVTQAWVRVGDSPAMLGPAAQRSAATFSRAGETTISDIVIEEPMRFIAAPLRGSGADGGIARFGPFRVLDEERAALVAGTDAASPAAFQAMLAAYPGLRVLEFRDAPGTSNDIANLRLGRMIRAAGLATHVPAGGSARSGAVELFLAGTRRSMDPGALFAVHSWRDAMGREPSDFAPDAPENRLYLDYYAEMGMSREQARAFYAMTNSVPHHGALWLRGAEMTRWIAPAAGIDTAPRSRSALALPAPALLAAPPATGLTGMSARAALVLALAGVRPYALPHLAYANLGLVDGAIPQPLALLDSGQAFP
ncbi:hypothetical protein [Erythrobacter tepidarius]|uniref:hypothetical protein n=1 Tax=Erythrobacter tepidarius TaxID=60454 RepID=UPI000A3CB5CB